MASWRTTKTKAKAKPKNGRKTTASEVSPQKLDDSARRKIILSQRRDGQTYQAIADYWGVSRQRIWAIISEEFKALNEERLQYGEDVLAQEEARLDHYLTKLKPRIDAGDIQAINMAAGISERRCRMLGVGGSKNEDWRPLDLASLIKARTEGAA